MTKLHQIQVKFTPLEDRLLLRVQTEDRSEFRFWLTRRFVKTLWPVLVKMLAADRTVRSQSDPQARQAVLSFQHQAAVERSDFETKYRQAVAATPLGEAPVLLYDFALAERALHPVLCLRPGQGPGIELTLTGTMLHSLCHLLADAVAGAGWDMRLKIGTSEETLRPPSSERLN